MISGLANSVLPRSVLLGGLCGFLQRGHEFRARQVGERRRYRSKQLLLGGAGADHAAMAAVTGVLSSTDFSCKSRRAASNASFTRYGLASSSKTFAELPCAARRLHEGRKDFWGSCAVEEIQTERREHLSGSLTFSRSMALAVFRNSRSAFDLVIVAPLR